MSSISEFLSGKVLVVTGGTGFVAKGVVEKLLRHAPDIKRIYLLIRPRSRSDGSAVSAEDRLEREVFQSTAFASLRTLWGADYSARAHQKISAVAFDLTQDGLDIDAACYAQLIQEVDIVISIAATVTFDEPIDLALRVNTLGPQRIVEFAKACRDAIFVHVSTAYVNGQMTGRIPEAPLPSDRSMAQIIGNGQASDYNLEAEIESIQQFGREVVAASRSAELDRTFRQRLEREDRGKRVTAHRVAHQLEALRARWVQKRLVEEGMRRGRQLGWHDSYTLTKAMGEQVIVKSRGSLPTAIIRPSIIESSLQDPEPGWLDGLKVADPLINHFSKGRLPDFPARPDIVVDVVPVDVVVNAIIAILPRVREEKEVKVYQVGTGSQNPLRVQEMFDYIYEYFKKYPIRDKDGNPIEVQPWRFHEPEALLRRYRLKYRMPLNVLRWAMDHVPAIPWSPRLRRKVSVQEATLDRVFSLIEIYSPYTRLECIFETGNTRSAFDQLSPEDREIFNCDVTRIRWREYFQDIHVPGLKRHVLKTGGR